MKNEEKLAYAHSEELLDFIKKNNLIDIADIQQKMELMKNKEILDSVNIWEQDRKGIHYFVTNLKDEKGKRKQVKSKSKEELERKILAHYKKMNCEQTTEDLFKEFRNYKSNYVSPNTILRYDSDWNKIVKTNLGFEKIPYNKIKKTDFDEFLPKLADLNSLNKKAFGSVCSLLRQMFEYACDKDYLEKNPFRVKKIIKDQCSSNKRGKNEEETYTDNEYNLLVKEMNRLFLEHPYNTASLGVILAFELGVRIGELMAINVSDINWEKCTITIHSQLLAKYEKKGGTYVRNGYEIADHVKMHSDSRDIPLSNLAIDTIKMVMDANKQYGYEKDGYLFVDKNGIKTPKMVEKQLYNGCKNLNIRYRSPHKMRKTYASTLINNNVPLPIVQNNLGHSEPATTLRFYTFDNTDKSEANKSVRNALNKRFEE